MKFNFSSRLLASLIPQNLKMGLNGNGANLIQSPDNYLTAKLIFEETNNFQKALVKRDQTILRNKKKDSRVSTNYCDWKLKLTITMKISRGGVEDSRLEVKTKDTKKIQGLGQPFRGQTLLRPRTEMLEAKDQGHKRVFSEKKVFKSFFRRSPIKNAF